MTKNWWDEQFELEITKGLRSLEETDNKFFRLNKAVVDIPNSTMELTVNVTRKTMKELRKSGTVASTARRYIRCQVLDEINSFILARELDCVLIAKFLWFKVELYRGKLHNTTYDYIK